MRTIYSFIFLSTIMLAAGFIGLSIPENNYIANSIVCSIFAVILFICVLLVLIIDIKEYKKKNK